MTQTIESTPSAIVEERERQIVLLSLLPEVKTYTLKCRYTGVTVATMQMLMQVGKLPYLTHWNDALVAHPLFALQQHQLLSWTRKQWNYLFRETTDRATEVQKEQFCIAFVAILHSLGSVKIEAPALPSFDTVTANMQRLLELAYWQHYLESQRFRFPTLRITTFNHNTALADIGAYFSVCDSARSDWESSKDAKQEEANIEAARRAEKSVRGSHIRAVSKKALWNWFLSSMKVTNSKKYDLPEWKEWREDSEKLWFGSENQQLSFSLDDVESIEDVFITTCELGSSVSNAFKTELNKIREHIHNHQTLFTIDWTTVGKSNVARVREDGTTEAATIVQRIPEQPGPEPQIGAFNSRVDYIRAHAKWKVMGMQYDAWLKQTGNSLDKGNES